MKKNEHMTSQEGSPLQTLAAVMDLILHEEDLMEAVEQSLMWIGKLVDQDRAYLFEIHTHPETKRVLTSQRCEWAREGVSAQIHNPNLINMDFLEIFPRWHDTFFEGKEISGAVRTFPQLEKDILSEQHIKSILAVPVFEKKLLRGFIGFDNCRTEYEWNDEEVAFLRTVASAIGSAMGRQRNIDRLKDSEARFRNLFEDVSTIAVRGFSKEGTVQYWNKACEDFYGFTSEEALGRNIYDLIIPESQRDHMENKLDQLTKGKKIVPEELLLEHMTGTPVQVLSSYTRINRKGFADEFFNFDVDLTGQKKMEQQFLRSQRMEAIGSLVGGIAHDLNNILSPIMITIDLLRQSEGKDQEPLLKILETSTGRAADMVMQILSFERGVKGKQIEIEVTSLLQELQQLLKDTLPKSIKFQTNIEGVLPNITGDPTQLQQVLLNLALNARDAMPEGGSITVTASSCALKQSPANSLGVKIPPGKYLKLSIQDTGEGMTEDVQLKVFEPFFSTKEEGKGTGLGLSSSLAILKSHHAAVVLKSSPGAGTKFTIYLPFSGMKELDTQKNTKVKKPPAGKIYGILLVDDEHNIRNIVKLSLEGGGYKVWEAQDGVEALEMYEKHQKSISLVIMDMMMPRMDGKTAIKKLHLLNPSLPILATSGMISLANDETLTSDDHVEFISKPFHGFKLLMKIGDMLDFKHPSD